MIKAIRQLWNDKPLVLIIWTAILFRLVAIFFSKGFGMHDDHFSTIEIAQSWIDGSYFSGFSFSHPQGDNPVVFDFFYACFNYSLLYILKITGISDPQVKMLIGRLVHAGLSLITIYAGYKITEILSDKKSARIAGLLLAIFWIMPFFSVRNMVEIVCMPFFMLGFLLLLKAIDKPRSAGLYFLAGMLFGISFLIRYQTALLLGGAGLVLLFRKKWKGTLILGLGALLIILLIHAVVDWLIWGKPFIELTNYIAYNISHRFDYITSPWYNYIILLIAILIPPISLMIFFGFFYTWKKYLLLFLPAFIFLAFHSYFPNKQERFILPVIPLLIILGIMGWNQFVEKSQFWKKNIKLHRGLWSFFWIINIALLLMITPMYSKKARVEAMVYLSEYKNIRAILVDDEQRDDATMVPLFYLNQWPLVYQVTKKYSVEDISKNLESPNSPVPGFVLFFDNKNLQKRLDRMKTVFPHLVFEKQVNPGFIDNIIYRLNPINANETIYIYRNPDIYPQSLNLNAS